MFVCAVSVCMYIYKKVRPVYSRHHWEFGTQLSVMCREVSLSHSSMVLKQQTVPTVQWHPLFRLFFMEGFLCGWIGSMNCLQTSVP